MDLSENTGVGLSLWTLEHEIREYNNLYIPKFSLSWLMKPPFLDREPNAMLRGAASQGVTIFEILKLILPLEFRFFAGLGGVPYSTC